MHWLSQDAWSELVAGTVRTLPTAESPTAESPSPQIIFPGAFNPLHIGHTEMARLTTEMLGGDVWFELSIENVDKPQLAYDEVARRLAQFVDEQIVLTSAATFAEKAAVFPGSTFVVGVDTLIRIGDARYYDGSHNAMLSAIDTIAAHDCRFLAFGRLLQDAFQTQPELQLPEQLTALCQGVNKDQFRVDISSTQLREES